MCLDRPQEKLIEYLFPGMNKWTMDRNGPEWTVRIVAFLLSLKDSIDLDLNTY